MNFGEYILAGIVLVALLSCEDAISLEVDEGETQLAVDGFLNNKPEVQKIVLLETKQFFSKDEQTPYIADSVLVTDDLNNRYVFEDSDGDGTYEWDDTVLVHVDRTYSLVIKKGTDIFSSSSLAKPVPQIDSINWEYEPAGLVDDNGTYIAELVVRDLAGQADYYRVKWAKNGVFVKGNGNINLSVDGAFSDLGQGDGYGVLFIPPISTFAATDFEDSLGLGDTFTYEVLSIEKSTYKFWNSVLDQNISGGIGALFATPTSNAKSNIKSNHNEISKTAVGWFSVSMISSMDQLIFNKAGEKLSFSEN